MYDLIAGGLRNSKLAAINEFMENNDIDVVQFESTTKVGKQGIIDLEDCNTRQEVLDRLSKTTGITDKNASRGIKNLNLTEDVNVVHRIPYSDYGFQTEVPEHGIDSIQLFGTQVRKLITADLDPDIKIKIEGFDKALTKKEWLDLYNRIITENIIESFKEVEAKFADPKLIEKEIKDAMDRNGTYSRDMYKACTLDKDGKFNIPLLVILDKSIYTGIISSFSSLYS